MNILKAVLCEEDKIYSYCRRFPETVFSPPNHALEITVLRIDKITLSWHS